MLFFRIISSALLINALTYVGILYFDWNLYQLFFSYWVEMILIIVVSKMYVNLDTYARTETLSSIRPSLLDLWWLFWLMLHFLFLFVFFKTAMKELIVLPDTVSPSNIFLYLIAYSLLLPGVLFSVISTVVVHLVNVYLDKGLILKGQIKGYHTSFVRALPFIYLFTNHMLILTAGVYSDTKTAHILSFPLSIAIIKTISDSLIYYVNHSKKITH